MTKTKDLSVEELEALLAEKKKAQKELEIKERETYVRERDKTISSLSKEASELNAKLQAFAQKANEAMMLQRDKLNEYGAIRKNSKGGFQIFTEDRTLKIKYAYNAIGDYDERANKAEELLKEFIEHMVKKSDKKAYNIIQGLLERNKAGQLEYSRIQALYKYESDFDDPRWKEALKLFKESFVVKDSKMQPLFYKLNENGKYEHISLNFSSM